MNYWLTSTLDWKHGVGRLAYLPYEDVSLHSRESMFPSMHQGTEGSALYSYQVQGKLRWGSFL